MQQLSGYLSGVDVNAASTGTQAPLIDAGKYPVAITKHEMRRPKDTSPWLFLEFEFTIQGGKFDGRKLKFSCPLEGEQTENMTAKSIKLADMLAEGASNAVGILKAAGHPNPNMPEQARVEGLRLQVKTVHGKSRDGGKENKVTGWEPMAQGTQAPGASGFAGPANPTGGYQQAARAQAPLNIAKNGDFPGGQAQNAMPQQSQAHADLNDDIPL